MDTIIRVGMLCGVAIVISERPAHACSCAQRPVCAAFWEVDRVFTGWAEVTPLGPGAQRARFRVEESFRGPADGVVEVMARGIGGSCAYAFVHGTRYLVYARRAADGTWSSFFCDPTAPLDQAAEGLAFSRGIARDSHRGGSLVGSVMMAERPLGGVPIALRGGPGVLSTTTDPSGLFTFKDVAVGRYVLSVSTPPRAHPVSPAMIEIKGPGACVVHPVVMVTGKK